MEIVIILAMDRKNAIGKSGKIPWRVPEDLKRFKQLTLGSPCIMGARTFDSLPTKSLPGRRVLIVSHRPGPHRFPTLQSALAECARHNYPIVFVCGGKSIYEEAINLADRIELTRVDIEVKDPDTTVDLDLTRWHLREVSHHANFSFETYVK